MKLSIIIPVYNEEQTIHEVIERVWAVDLGGIDREVIIANDGSSDGTRSGHRRQPLDQRPAREELRQPDQPRQGRRRAARARRSRPATSCSCRTPTWSSIRTNTAGCWRRSWTAAPTSCTARGFSRRPAAWRCGAACANRFLTLLTNVLFGGRLTDMETAYKVFRRETLAGIRLRCVGFDFEPEITAKFLRAGHRILEVPIAYTPRHAGRRQEDSLDRRRRCDLRAGEVPAGRVRDEHVRHLR